MEVIQKKRVCVIGAGASGLAAIRHINASKTLQGIVFEASGDIGGTWNYSDQTDPFVSSIYKGLKTNLPKQIMGFLDFPLTTGQDDFIMHDDVLEYLNLFADKFQLRSHVRFNTKIISVMPILEEQFAIVFEDKTQVISDYKHLKWKVGYNTPNNEKIEYDIFDAILVCNGHFSEPLIPNVSNLTGFQGEIMHSKNYKVPEQFQNKRVVVFGCGPSGIDILLEIANFADKVTLSMRNPPFAGHLPDKIIQKGSIEAVEGKMVKFQDGSSDIYDVILICTGYEYAIPFMSPECGLEVIDGKLISPLYRHMINIHYPTMALIGLPFRICPFMIFDCQVRYFIGFLDGNIPLPFKNEMIKTLEEEKQYREDHQIPFRRSHQLEELQWPYMQALGDEAGFADLLIQWPLFKEIYDKVAKRRKAFPALYKNDKINFRENKLFIVEYGNY